MKYNNKIRNYVNVNNQPSILTVSDDYCIIDALDEILTQ